MLISSKIYHRMSSAYSRLVASCDKIYYDDTSQKKMKARSYASPRRKFKHHDPSLVPITNFFISPAKSSDEVKSKTPKKSPEVEIITPKRELKQHPLEFFSPREKTNSSTEVQSPPSKRSLFAVLEKLDIPKKKTRAGMDDSEDDDPKCESEDDLPECYQLSQSSQVSAEPSPMKISVWPVAHKYQYDLDSILAEKDRTRDTNLELKRMEQELKEGIKAEDTTAIFKENGLTKSHLLEFRNEIKTDYPGISLFDSTRCFQLYTSLPPLRSPANIEKTDFDKLFETPITSLSLITEMLQLFSNKMFIENSLVRPWLLSHIFHLMSILPDCRFSQSCLQVFQLVNSTNCKWKPEIIDFVTILVNFGADLTKLLPEEIEDDYTIEKLKTYCSDNPMDQSESGLKPYPFMNLILVIETITIYVHLPNTYKDEDKALLLFITCTIFLDEKMKDSLAHNKIMQLVDALISNFSDMFWEREMYSMVKNLLSISSHHHNIVCLVKVLPYTQRGRNFQKLFCCTALKLLTGHKIEETVPNIGVKHFIRLCKMLSIHRIKDFYKLHSAMELVNCYISAELEDQALTKEILDQLNSILRSTSDKLIDRIYNMDSSLVKNYISQIIGKLSLLQFMVPSNQRTIFHYASTTPIVEQVPSSELTGDMDEMEEE